MKHSSAESRDDMFGQSESELETKLALAVEAPSTEAKVELDEECQYDLNSDLHSALGWVLEMKMGKAKKSELLKLQKRLEEVLEWYKLQ